MPTAVELILKKRDGGELRPEDFAALMRGMSDGSIADYQVSALLMAIFFRGLTHAETLALTRAMLNSGRVLRLGSVRQPKVDKHSTGGVGDKISLCLAPLVAACGVAVPMISGRGLGHTGGTLDKLEAIPGYRVELDARSFERIVRTVGTSMIGQTAELSPADRKLYALRDVTGTVDSIPLIVASILSKKLASGIDALVLDVKAGRGAFMKDQKSARALAKALVRVGSELGKRVVALVTDMSSPIGLSIGNALETREAIAVLRDGGPADTRELTLALGVEMLLVSGVSRSAREARKRLEGALADGSGFERLLRMVHAHGGDVRCVEQPERLPRARSVLPVLTTHSGFVTGIDALALGLSSLALGAGRTRADQPVDASAGIVIEAPLGTRVERGAPLARIHGPSSARTRSELERVRGAFVFGPKAPPEKSRILERISSKDAVK